MKLRHNYGTEEAIVFGKVEFFYRAIFTASLHTLITTGIQFNLYQFLPAVLNLNPFKTALAVLPFSLATLFAVISPA